MPYNSKDDVKEEGLLSQETIGGLSMHANPKFPSSRYHQHQMKVGWRSYDIRMITPAFPTTQN